MPHGEPSAKLSSMSASLAVGRITVPIRAAASRQHLLPDARNRLDGPGDRQLPGHGHVTPRRPTRERRDEGDGQRHPRRRAVLRPGGFGQVHVHVRRVVEPGVADEPCRVRAHPRQRDIDRLPQERPGRPVTRNWPRSGRARRLDDQHLAACRRGGQTHDDPGPAGPPGDLRVAEPRRAEPGRHRLGRHLELGAHRSAGSGGIVYRALGGLRTAPRRGVPDPAPITGRAGTGVRSATIENCTAAAFGLPALSCAAPAAMSTVTAPEAAGVIVAV